MIINETVSKRRLYVRDGLRTYPFIMQRSEADQLIKRVIGIKRVIPILLIKFDTDKSVITLYFPN